MKTNLSLGRISGIKIIIHWTFFLLIAWVVFDELNRGGNAESVLFNLTVTLTGFLFTIIVPLILRIFIGL